MPNSSLDDSPRDSPREDGLGSPRKRRERERTFALVGAPGGAGGGGVQRLLCGRMEARNVAFVGMFFVTLTAASLYSLLAPFFPSVAGASPAPHPQIPRARFCPLSPPAAPGAR